MQVVIVGMEMFERHRVVGGLVGAGYGLAFLMNPDLEPGPLVFFMLLGAVVGTKTYRVFGTVAGALVYCVLEAGGWWPGFDSRLWFAISCVPVGGLLAGARRRADGGREQRNTAIC